MNKLTRLTALLLAMLMIFSTVASAETAFQVGGMTVENWQGIVDSAVERLNREIEGGDVYPLPSPPVVDSQPYAETHEVWLAAGSFTMSKADLALVKSEQSGQWQIAVGETVNDQNETVYLWANLAGETGVSLNVNYTMLQNFPYYVIRQVSYNADNQLVQVGMLTFTLTEPAAVMKLNAMARDGETNPETGNAASEQTSTPWSFERSNDDRLSNVVITYMFDGSANTMPETLRNTKAADDDGIENCVIGGTVTNSVPNPNITGYKVSYATVNGTRVEVGDKLGTDADNITITQGNVAMNGYTIPANDVEIVVYYTSAVVAYTVKSKFEPVNGGSHVTDPNYPDKKVTDNPDALTGHTLTIEPDAVPGYQVLYFDEPVLAANGSTSVNVYYNRSWYLTNFDLDGGYGVAPIYAKYGTAIEVPVGDKAPIKPGYVFQGWDGNGDGVADTMPTTMPASNTTYKALWKMEPVTTVTIVYWAENADDDDYSYQSSEVTRVASGESFTYTTGLTCPLEENHEHGPNCNLVCEVEEHTHDASCYEFVCTETIHIHEATCYGNCPHTEHTIDCYTWSAGTRQQATPSNYGTLTDLGNGIYFYDSNYGSNYDRYYVKIGNQWWNNTTRSATVALTCTHDEHSDSCLSCPESVHQHTDYMGTCYTKICTKSVHVHGAACYDCGYVEHTHDEVCTVAGPGTQLLNTTLYTYKEADTVTSVNPDGSSVVNVYYDRVEYTVGFYSNQSCTDSKEYTSLRITAKWGAKILDKWPSYEYENGKYSASWLVEGKNNTWQNSIQVMPVGGAKFWGPKTGNNSYKAYYYVEALPGDTDTVTQNGVTYKLHHTDVSVSSGNVTDEERYGIDGFTYKEGTKNGESYSNAKFYYTRNSYNLVFNNGEVDKRTESVKFEAPLGAYADYKLTAADAPSQYEPGSMEFAGWYLNPECTDEAKVEFTNALKMPSTNVIVYAKWVQVKHDVTFYRSEDDAVKHGTNAAVTPLTETFQVTHNELALETNIPVTDPENPNCITPPENCEFDGWFYRDGNEEKPYTKEMPVTQDLVIYAKWKTTQVANFTVRYVYVDANGKEIEIAESLEGKTMVGQNMTFDAKTGVELDEDHRTKYFPTVYSQAITINADATQNVCTFYYTYKDSEAYTVYYVEVSSYTENANGTFNFTLADPAKPYIMEPKTLQATTSFVAADFIPVVGYVAADGVYHKTLNVVAGAPSTDNGNYIADTYNAEKDEGIHENIIVFYYFKDPTKSPYTIYHKVQNLDLSGFTEVEEDTIRGTGTNGTLYGDNLNVYENYEYLRAEVVYYVNETTTKTEDLVLNANDGWDISYRLPENGYGMTINIYYELSVGHLAITKNVVTPPGFAPMQDKFKITIELKDANGNVYTNAVKYQIGEGQEVEATLTNGRFTVQLEAGETVLIKNLLHGTTYTVTEAAVTGFTTDITTTQDHNLVGAIDAGQTDTVVVKNTYKVGSLNVTKTVQGADAPKVNGVFSDEFSFTLAVPGFAGLKVTFNGTERTLDGNGETTFTMKHGETVTINGIPDGANYTVTETANRDYTTKANDQPVYTVSDTMKAGNVATAAFVNTYKYSHLTIKKTGMEPGESAIFQVTGYSKYNNDQEVTFTVTVPNGGSVTIGELLIGSEYTITEIGSWSNRYAAATVPSGTIVEGGGEPVTVTNGDKNQQWLHDEDYVHNDFSKPGSYGN